MQVKLDTRLRGRYWHTLPCLGTPTISLFKIPVKKPAGEDSSCFVRDINSGGDVSKMGTLSWAWFLASLDTTNLMWVGGVSLSTCSGWIESPEHRAASSLVAGLKVMSNLWYIATARTYLLLMMWMARRWGQQGRLIVVLLVMQLAFVHFGCCNALAVEPGMMGEEWYLWEPFCRDEKVHIHNQEVCQAVT